MPAFSFHLPRFRRSRRSDSQNPSPSGSRNDTAASQPPCSGSSLVLPHSQNSTSRFSVDRAEGNARGQPSLPVKQRHPSDNELPPSQYQNQGMFNQAQNFSATGNTFIDGPVSSVMLTNNFNVSNNFMEKLLKETIPGAAADSSARDPPPRCHPGTRLAILERCLYFIVHCNMEKKMRWVVGAAGVGKSAVMQSVADSPQLAVACNASCFFSVNGRSDGAKVVMTLSYQFSAQSKVYRQLIEGQVADDPKLLESSITVQFEKFIVQPFIYNNHLNSSGHVLVIIDGLDECNNTRTQVELLRLIVKFCASYPSSPIAWLIASRPEPHITSFFSRPDVIPVYEKEEIAVDSNEACADVERFLRYELMEIGKESDFLGPHWPDERVLWKLASAAGGLFAYAQTVIRYIGDATTGDPLSQLSDVLNAIDEHPMSDVPPEQHPMALLDALYAQILSKIPPKIMANVQKLLLLLASDWDSALDYSDNGKNFIIMCNWLGMTADEAYMALNRLRSVLDIPHRNKAHKKVLKPFHKSLIDYLYRSALIPNVERRAQQLRSQCTFRVLKEAPGGIDFGDGDYEFGFGVLARRGTGNKVSITWRADDGINWDDNRTRLSMYKLAIGEVAAGMGRGDPEFQTEFCIKLLTTRFKLYNAKFPYSALSDVVFDPSRRYEFIKHGILKQRLVEAINNCDIIENSYIAKLQFHRPVVATILPDPWDLSCAHKRVGQWEQGKEQDWTTSPNLARCAFCDNRLVHQLRTWTHRHPDHALLVLFASEQNCCVELRFVDPEDHVSEWTYWLWIYSFHWCKRLENYHI